MPKMSSDPRSPRPGTASKQRGSSGTPLCRPMASSIRTTLRACVNAASTGLMTTPQSSMTRYRCSLIAQVPGSIATIATWQALENVPGGSNVARASRPPRSTSASRWAWK